MDKKYSTCIHIKCTYKNVWVFPEKDQKESRKKVMPFKEYLWDSLVCSVEKIILRCWEKMKSNPVNHRNTEGILSEMRVWICKLLFSILTLSCGNFSHYCMLNYPGIDIFSCLSLNVPAILLDTFSFSFLGPVLPLYFWLTK